MQPFKFNIMPVNPYKNAFENIPHTKEQIEEFQSEIILTGLEIMCNEAGRALDTKKAHTYFNYLIQYIVNVTALQFLRGQTEDLEDYYKLNGAEARREFFKNRMKEIEIYKGYIDDNRKLLEEILGI